MRDIFHIALFGWKTDDFYQTTDLTGLSIWEVLCLSAHPVMSAVHEMMNSGVQLDDIEERNLNQTFSHV